MIAPRKTLLVFLIFSFIYGQEIRQVAYNKYVATSTKTFEATSPGELVIKSFRGDIVINGQSANEVTILRETYLIVKSEEKAERLLDEARMTMQTTEGEAGATVVILEGPTHRIRHVSDNLSISVPHTFSVASRSHGGDIDMRGVQGEIDVSTSGGDIDLEDLSGKITAHTSGGDVEGTGIGGRVTISTSGGSIEFEDVRGELNGKTSGGDVTVENVQGSVTLKTSGGEIELYDVVGREIFGHTSGGDVTARDLVAETTIDLHTSGGDIDLEEISGDLEASTSGGDIEIVDVRGSVKVWTSGGEIEAEQVRGSFDGRTSAGDISLSKIWDQQYEDHQIDVKTSVGDIELILPRDFPADFSLRVLSPGRDPGEAILSDFPLDITASRNVSRAEGIVEDGRFDVRIEASMGTIRIKQEK